MGTSPERGLDPDLEGSFELQSGATLLERFGTPQARASAQLQMGQPPEGQTMDQGLSPGVCDAFGADGGTDAPFEEFTVEVKCDSRKDLMDDAFRVIVQGALGVDNVAVSQVSASLPSQRFAWVTVNAVGGRAEQARARWILVQALSDAGYQVAEIVVSFMLSVRVTHSFSDHPPMELELCAAVQEATSAKEVFCLATKQSLLTSKEMWYSLVQRGDKWMYGTVWGLIGATLAPGQVVSYMKAAFVLKVYVRIEEGIHLDATTFCDHVKAELACDVTWLATKPSLLNKNQAWIIMEVFGPESSRQRAMRLGDTGLPGAYHVVKVQEDEAMVASAFVTEPAPSPAPSYLSQCHDVGSEDPGVQ